MLLHVRDMKYKDEFGGLLLQLYRYHIQYRLQFKWDDVFVILQLHVEHKKYLNDCF